MDLNILSSPASTVPAPPPIATVTTPVPVPEPEQNTVQENTSGMGAQNVVPEEIKGWSWGGFLWTWIWAIGNKTWIGLLGIISPINLIIAIVLGIKGREWAWQNKKWGSIEAFKKTQRNWGKWWLIINGTLTVIAIVGIIFTVILAAVNPQRQIQLANCVKNCPTTGDSQVCIQNCKSNLQSSNSSSVGSLNSNIGISTPLPVVFSPTPIPTQVVSPTVRPTSVPTNTPTKAPSTKFQSTGTQTLENGVTGIVPSANLSANVVSISITFKNTSASSQNAYLVHIQMHDQNLGEPAKENYFSVPLGPGESRTFSLSFDALPNPPYKIEYAAPSGLVNLGTYTP